MSSLSGAAHKRKAFSATSAMADSGEPIDEAEQTRVVEEMQTQASEQSESTRRLFAVVFAIIAGIFIVLTLQSCYDPWKMEHQRHFKELVPHWVFLAYYIASAFCFLIAASVVLDRSVTMAVVVSRYLAVATAVMVCMMWAKIFHTHKVSNPLLFWIPLVDLAGLALAQYVHLDSKSLVAMAEGLQQYKYSHKSA